MIQVAAPADFDAWRESARRLLLARIAPGEVLWSGGQRALFDALPTPGPPSGPAAPRVPAAFMDLAQLVACHRSDERWDLLYQALYRLQSGRPQLLLDLADPLVHRLRRMEQAVRRDEHKMHAFVRFRRCEREGAEHFIAWHRPDHRIVRLCAPFFVRRFAAMRWTIMTPDETAEWDGSVLRFGPGVVRPPADGDELDELWRAYYGAVFNPARINLRATKREMPVRHWRTLPEARDIDALVREAPARVEEMMRRGQAQRSAEAYLPAVRTLPVLSEAVRGCAGCELCTTATQAVFGEGPVGARLFVVGEQPGDREDVCGRPFSGPAGRLLDALLSEAGLLREDLYLTNAVKHFRHRLEGERRLHVTPSQRHVVACRPWLQAEIQAVRPERILCLGNTAARALLGPQARVNELRGAPIESPWAPELFCTHHPAAILRAPDITQRERLRTELLADLRECGLGAPHRNRASG